MQSRARTRSLSVATLILCATAFDTAPAQATWTKQGPVQPDGRYWHATAFDSANGRTVLFGGDRGHLMTYADTWEWDGNVWVPRTTGLMPPSRKGHAMAYDSSRRRLVLFGGHDALAAAVFLGDTWEWDGTSWTQIAPARSPEARYGHSLAYDTARGRVVLFGGQGDSGYLRDTWEWDGANWVQRQPAVSPPGRAFHALSWHQASGKVVLFSGAPASGLLTDTWEWDGTNWTLRTLATSPPARFFHALAFDLRRSRMVLSGGYGPSGVESGTWEWDGVTWTLRAGGVPAPRTWTAMSGNVQGRGVLLFGGMGVGYQADTWSFDGVTWRQHVPAVSPSFRFHHAMATDLARGRVVLFGGFGVQGPPGLADTWEWDGTNWNQKNPAASPAPRFQHAMTYDFARRVTVLFGGYPAFGDTWEWDGTTWSARTATPSPVGRSRTAMAYDPLRSKVVLFGGLGTTTFLSDTWEWDGTTWVQRQPAVSPPARYDPGLVYDFLRNRVVLFAGRSAQNQDLADTWEWDGTNWVQQATPSTPLPRSGPAMAFDIARARTVLFGGLELSGNLGDTWEYGTPNPAAYVSYGSGCPGTAGIPSLAAAPGQLPWIGNPFALELGSLPPIQATAVILSGSRSSWGTLPLPLDLTSLGMTGCSLLARPTLFLLPRRAGSGRAVLDLPIPNDRGLVGGSLYGQALVFDPGANPFGATSSNGGEAKVGMR